MITTKKTALSDPKKKQKKNGWGAKTAPHPFSSRSGKAQIYARRKIVLLIVVGIIVLSLTLHDLVYTSWYQEWHLSRMSLAALQQERGSRLDDPRMLYYIGLRLNQQHRFAEADPYLRNAVGIDPNSSRLRDAWAQALVGSGLIKAAFGELREFAGTHPQSAQAHLLLGKFYITQHSMRRAIEELREAVKIDPSLGEGWSFLAAAQTGLNETADAQISLEHAVALRPQSVSDHLGLAVLLASQGQTQAARPFFVQSVSIAPQSADVHREYARFLMTASNLPADQKLAETEAHRALTLAPNDPDTLLVLGRILVAQGEIEEALSYLSQAAQLNPYDPAPALVLAQTYQHLGQVKQMHDWQQNYITREHHSTLKEDLVSAILKNPQDPQPQRHLAQILAEEGDVAGCTRHLGEALHCAPDAPPAQAAAAADLLAAGKPELALPLAQRAVAVAPNNPMAREAMGDIMLNLGRPQDAAAYYSQAGGMLPDHRPLYKHKLALYAHLHGGSVSDTTQVSSPASVAPHS